MHTYNSAIRCGSETSRGDSAGALKPLDFTGLRTKFTFPKDFGTIPQYLVLTLLEHFITAIIIPRCLLNIFSVLRQLVAEFGCGGR